MKAFLVVREVDACWQADVVTEADQARNEEQDITGSHSYRSSHHRNPEGATQECNAWATAHEITVVPAMEFSILSSEPSTAPPF